MKKVLFSSALAASLLATLSLAGCGGGSTTPALSAAAYAGTRTSTLTLADGRVGMVNMTVSESGAITGTLTVQDGASRSRAYSFSLGIYNITGSVDPETGAFTMTGDIPGSGPFTMTGILPTASNSGGSYTLTAGGQTYTGTWGGGITPTPTPGPNPTPSPTPAPTPAPGSDFSTQGTTGTQSLTFSDNTSNMPLPTFPTPDFSGINSRSTSPVGGAVSYTTQAGVGYLPAGQQTLRNYRKFAVTFVGADVALGSGPYNAANGSPRASGDGVVQVTCLYYVDNGNGTYTQRSVSSAFGGSGTVEVVGFTSERVTYRLTNVVMKANPVSETTGSLTVNGEISCNLR